MARLDYSLASKHVKMHMVIKRAGRAANWTKTARAVRSPFDL